jgi:hypothetical protein
MSATTLMGPLLFLAPFVGLVQSCIHNTKLGQTLHGHSQYICILDHEAQSPNAWNNWPNYNYWRLFSVYILELDLTPVSLHSRASFNSRVSFRD